jgi:hypothetical protein
MLPVTSTHCFSNYDANLSNIFKILNLKLSAIKRFSVFFFLIGYFVWISCNISGIFL